MNSMRLEKAYRAWGMDLTTERTPLEAGLGALVRTKGRDFIGREALLALADSKDAWRMALLELTETDGRDPFHMHTVFAGDRPVGIVTSGAWGHRVDRALGLAYLTPAAPEGADLAVEIIGHRSPARALDAAPYDAENRLLRDDAEPEAAGHG